MKGFQPGNQLGKKGRPKKIKSQVKDWIKDHPFAVSELMEALYDAGIKGDTESAQYVIDRIKGKPKQQTVVELEGADQLSAGFVLHLFAMLKTRNSELDEPLLIGGKDGEEGSSQDTETEPEKA